MSDLPTADRADFRQVLTERLDLRAVCLDDLDALYAINADPAGWRHQPEGRHATPATTREWIERAVARWEGEGLSYWTVRLRGEDEVIGVGGVQLIASRGDWNLFYRLAHARWGRGYATEMSAAAIDAGHRHSPDVPVVAWIHAHNEGSRAVAARLGLIDHGLRLEPFFRRRLYQYADRPVPDANPSDG
ncbi:RimJ/RimL family protein N-acetyltransferase [Kitasatospora sp. MAA4]|uniref:GNAT family N-acetyltransferase n=1 Tax=Kitasatospora sp. MAA4 TaxID=3035093 RepID=UPI0024757DDC|nr:GNAT family N-acetyltransferase [Kitasatospora sp. MAA4]MDH6132889.1 RimJ/RimL family protein N-acetyltransferase [Kitasatospora sp. MAA4]